MQQTNIGKKIIGAVAAIIVAMDAVGLNMMLDIVNKVKK